MPATSFPCIACPRGCALSVSDEAGARTISGHSCPRGRAYAERRVPPPAREGPAAGGAPAAREGERFPTHVLLDPGDFLVTSPFGERVHPVSGARRFHAGVDGALWTGGQLVETGICAWGDGTVAEAHGADDGPAGVFVAIDHGGGLVTKYFHLELGTLRVEAGEKVARGQLLGWMGATGLSTGEHLHFQVEVNGAPVDPVPYLRGPGCGPRV